MLGFAKVMKTDLSVHVVDKFGEFESRPVTTKKTPLLAFPALQCLASIGRPIFFSVIVGLLRRFQASHYLFSSPNVIEDGKWVELCFSGCPAKF